MTYAVTWSENGDSMYSGRLELGPNGVLFYGAADGSEAQSEFRYEDLVALSFQRQKLSGRATQPTLVLTNRADVRIEIASLQGLGTLHEVADRVELERGKAAV